MNIHIVEPLKNFVKLQDKKWESGWWNIGENDAKNLVGSKIYFHKTRLESSFFGGIITEYRIEQSDLHQGRIVFTFQYDAECRNVDTDKFGWSKNIKINQQ
jgi:hypothetical protein